jgi:DNA-binding response OmpR family regulator
LEAELRADRRNRSPLNELLATLLQAMDEAIAAEGAPRANADVKLEPGAPRRRRAGYRPLILIVDDDVAILTIIKSALADRAHVHVVDDGMAALAALRTVRYDLVLLDQNMPYISGLDILANGRLRVDGIQTPVVMVSAVKDAEQVSLMLQSGACGYVVKPFQPERLIADIETILGGAPPIALVADDDPLVREALCYEFGQAGAKVLLASSCEEALAMARLARPHLVVLDRTMPGGDGLDVLSALRREQSTSAMAVVLLSARCSDADILDGYARDADDYLKKPFTPQGVVDRCLDFLSPIRPVRSIEAPAGVDR